MARQRELLSLTDIAEETGISYPTLRNYVIKYGDEIPSEGTGRSTRYPRQAVKVFQRLRKESKPGRKPASALPVQAPAAPVRQLPIPPSREQAAPPVSTASAASTAPAAIDTRGIERELGGIRMQLQRIADAWIESLQSGTAASLAIAPAAEETESGEKPKASEAPAAPGPVQEQAAESAPAVPEPLPIRKEGIRDLETARATARHTVQSYGGRQARTFTPKVPGKKGPRPE